MIDFTYFLSLLLIYSWIDCQSVILKQRSIFGNHSGQSTEKKRHSALMQRTVCK